MHNHAAQSSLAFHEFIHFSFTNLQGWPKIKKIPVQAFEGLGEKQLPIILFLQRKKFQPVKANRLQNKIKGSAKGIKMPLVFLLHYIEVKCTTIQSFIN